MQQVKRKPLIRFSTVKGKPTTEGRLWFIFFLVTMLGGAIRKWFVASSAAGNIVLLIQMVLPFLMYYLSSPKAKNPFQHYGILGIYFFYLVLQIFNPLQVSIFHGLLGLIVHGMIWIGLFYYLANRDLFNLDMYLKPILILVLGEVILAFIQYSLPQGHFLNKYAHEGSENIAIVGDRVRITGTFSYLSGYTAFLLFYPFFVWALIFKRSPTWLVFSVALAGFITAFMTGSRSGVFLYFIFVGFALYENYDFKDIAPIIGKLVLPVAIAMAILLSLKGNELGKQVITAYDNFWGRVTGLRERGEESQRLTWDFRYFQGDRFRNPIIGIGTGSTYQGATILFGTSPHAKAFGYVESEFIKVILEGGFILVLLRLILAWVFVSQLCFGGKLFKFSLWFALVYAAPIVFNIHNASFLLLGLIYIDSAAWQARRLYFASMENPKGLHGSKTSVPQLTSALPGYPQVFDNAKR
jgi:hypothetical protein